MPDLQLINRSGGGFTFYSKSGSTLVPVLQIDNTGKILGLNSGADQLALNAATSGVLTLKAPNTVSTYTITLPSSQGAANTTLVNNGLGVLSWSTIGGLTIGGSVSGGTSGSILFVNSSGNLAQSNSQLFWDNTNSRLGIGTTNPSVQFEVIGTAKIGTNPTGNGNLLVGSTGTFTATFLTTQTTNYVDIRDTTSNRVLLGSNSGDMIIHTGSGLTERLRVLASNGNVGIGTPSPSSLLSVGSSSQFQINSSGNIVKINNVSYSFPSSQGASSAVLTNDGSGNLSWAIPSGGGSSSIVENFSNVDHIISTNQTLPLVQSTIKSDIGSAITTGQRILFRGQTNSSENGIYSYSSFAVVPATFNSLNYSELASLTFTLTSINWTTSYFGWPPPSTKDTAIGTQWDFGFNPASAQTAYISSDNEKIVVYDNSSQSWIALKFNTTIPLLSTPDIMNLANWNTTSTVGITVTDSNNPDITTGNTLYQAGTPTNAVYNRATDADISAEFFYGRAVSTPSGMYRYAGISSPTLGSTSLPFDRIATNQAFEQDNSSSFGNINNRCLIITATSDVTISSITNSVIIFTNLVNVTINTISNSYISGPMSSNAIINNFTINGATINGSDIKWRGTIFIPSSCEINHTNISCSSLYLGSQSSSNLITSNYAFIRAGNVYVYDDVRFDNSDIAGYFYARGGTSEFITLMFRIGTIFTGSVSMDSLNSTLTFSFAAIANIADLLVNSAVGTVRFNVFYGASVNIGKAKLNTGISQYSFNISNESEVKIGSLYTLNALSVTTPNNSTLMIGVIYPGSGTVNTAPANSRNFVSHNDSETWHTSAGAWGTN